MLDRKRKPKITYPTQWLADYPSHLDPIPEGDSGLDPYASIRRGKGGAFEYRDTLHDIPLSAFQHEPFQRILDTLEEHFNIMWDDEVSIEHGRRRRRKAPGQKYGYGYGELYKKEERFGSSPYTIYAQGFITEPEYHDVQLRYIVHVEDPPSEYKGRGLQSSRAESLESRWDIGNWTLYIDKVQIPMRDIEKIIRLGGYWPEKFDEAETTREIKRIEGIKELDWN